MSPQSNDDSRVDNGQLTHQIRPEDTFLLGQRVTIARRTVFNDISDVDLASLQPDTVQHLVQKLARCPDEGFALQIFLFTRRFTDKNYLTAGVTITDHQLSRLTGQLSAHPIRNDLLG